MLLCAEIVNTRGLSGEVKALSYADNFSFFDGIKELFLEDRTPLKIIYVKQHKGTLLIKFNGIECEEEAVKLKGKKLYVPRNKAKKLPEGRYYVVDIIGTPVFTEQGRKIGEVTNVFKTGSNDVFTVSDGKKEYYIPVVDEFVPEIFPSEKIIIRPIKGLIDDED